jgi:hypothetical protein
MMGNLAGFLEQIINLGIRSGDNVMLTCDVAYLNQIDVTPVEIVSGINEILAPTGTMVIPAYSDASWVFKSSTFQPNPLAESLADLPDAILSSHPTHPFCASGRLASVLIEGTESGAPFGRDSVPFRMLQAGAKQIMLGCGLHQNPFIYLAENILKVPYSDRSITIGVKLSSGKTVRKLLQMPGCGTGFTILEENGFLKVSPDNKISVAAAREIYDAAKSELKDEQSILLCEEPDCDICAQSRAIIDATEMDKQDKEVTALAEEEENTRMELERKLDGRVTFFETDYGSIKPN